MRNKLLSLAALSLLAAPLTARAGGYAVPNVNPRDLGMAGSLVAAQQDAAAVFANPAALAGLPAGLNLSIGGSLIDFRANWQDPNGTASSSMLFHPATPPAAYAAWAGKWDGRGWGVGAGVTIPFGGNVYWPKDWAGRFEIITVNRRVWGTYLNGGIEALPWLKVGGGLVYYHTTEYLKQGLNYVSSESYGELSTKGGKASFQLATEILPFGADVPVKVGVDYKHQAVQKLTGQGHFNDPPPQLQPNALDQDITHVLTAPNTLQIGTAWAPAKGALLTAAFTWDRFKVYQADTFVGSAGTVINVPRDYHNGYTFRLGGELQVNDLLTMRGGVLRDIAPTPKTHLSPTIPDADTWAGSVGATVAATSRLDVTFAAFFARMDRWTSEGPAAFPGTYDINANIFSVGVVWKAAP